MTSPLSDIGAELQQARLAQGLELAVFAERLRIQVRQLEALEAGNAQELPEPVYVKIFIREYAKALELDGNDMANRYWDTRPLPPLPAKPSGRTEVEVPSWVMPSLLGVLIFGAIIALAVAGHRSKQQRQDVLAATASAPVATASLVPGASGSTDALFAASASATGSEGATAALAALAASASSPAPSPTATVLQVVASPSASPSASPLPPMVATGTELRFRTHNTEDVWMGIVADGRELFSGTLPAGTERVWVAKGYMNVRIGRPSAVEAWLNDRLLGHLGDRESQVYRRQFQLRRTGPAPRTSIPSPRSRMTASPSPGPATETSPETPHEPSGGEAPATP